MGMFWEAGKVLTLGVADTDHHGLYVTDTWVTDDFDGMIIILAVDIEGRI